MKNTEANKQMLLEQLAKVPIIEAACQKTGISRMTFYRWKKEDSTFLNQVDEALHSGQLFVNDLAENQLISSLKDRNLSAVQYWLKHHHPDYANKLQVKHEIQEEDLTPEQEEIVRKALGFAAQSGDKTLIVNKEDSNESQSENIAGSDRRDDQGQESQNGNH